MIDELSKIFQDVGVKKSDSILLYSNFSAIAKIIDIRKIGASNRRNLLSKFHQSIVNVIGEDGAILTLGSFTDYARYGAPFHVDRSLPDQTLGAYPRFIFSEYECIRSYNPTSNLLGLGRNADKIVVRNNATAYGLGTPWEQLIKHNAKIIFFDTTLRPMTFGHHIEQCVGVPHVYSKIYDSPIYLNGVLIPFPVITSVRYLDFSIRYNMSKLEAEAKSQGLVKSKSINNFTIDLIECNPFAEFLTNKLIEDPYYLLDSEPSFVAGRIPFDGFVGPEDVSISNVLYGKREGKNG